MPKRIAVINDTTTTGGKVISASGTVFDGTSGVALLGDLAYCPKCKSTGKIIQGARDFIIDGKPAAYNGCIIACKCTPVGSHKIIATQSSMFVSEQASPSMANATKQPNSSLVKNSKTLNDVILDKWIGFKLPLNRDYSGLNFVVTLSNGELLKGIFNKNNEARLPINSECDSATIKIENFKSLENDSVKTSITETLLNKIIG